MTAATFAMALDFAIDREKEAVSFYQNLQKLAVFESQKELMREFEDMEKGHVRLLEGVKKNQDVSRLSLPISGDMKLDDFLAAPAAPGADMTYQDILLTGMAREKKSAALYSRLRDDTEDSVLQDVFSRLVREEENHRDFFEKLYDRDIQSGN
jgi:rubrerythrin